LLPPEPQDPIDIEDVTPQTLESSVQQLRKLGLEEDPEDSPNSANAPQDSADPQRRPFFKDGKEYALWILEHPDQADPEERSEIRDRLKKDALYRTWLGLEDEGSAAASASA